MKNRNLSAPEKIARIAAIEAEAQKVFGSAKLAKEWLTQKNIVFGNSPLFLLDTEIGESEVRKALSSIATGGVI